MRTPLRITFQNTPSSDAIRQLIEEQAGHLEQFFGRMTDCHVVFKTPDGNHRNGDGDDKQTPGLLVRHGLPG